MADAHCKAGIGKKGFLAGKQDQNGRGRKQTRLLRLAARSQSGVLIE